MHAALLAAVLAYVLAVTAAVSNWDKSKGAVPEVGSLELDLMIILQRAQFEASQPAYLAGTDNKLRDLVVKARADMFDTYDAVMAGALCAGQKSMRRRRAVIEYATLLLNDYLFRAAKLDLHNGCLALSSDFGSVVYGPK